MSVEGALKRWRQRTSKLEASCPSRYGWAYVYLVDDGNNRNVGFIASQKQLGAICLITVRPLVTANDIPMYDERQLRARIRRGHTRVMLGLMKAKSNWSSTMKWRIVTRQHARASESLRMSFDASKSFVCSRQSSQGMNQVFDGKPKRTCTNLMLIAFSDVSRRKVMRIPYGDSLVRLLILRTFLLARVQ